VHGHALVHAVAHTCAVFPAGVVIAVVGSPDKWTF